MYVKFIWICLAAKSKLFLQFIATVMGFKKAKELVVNDVQIK